MRPRLARGLVDLGRGEQPGRQRDGRRGQAARIARAVEALVEHARDRADLGQPGLMLEHALGEIRDGAHPFPLDGRQRAGPVPRAGRDADGAEPADEPGALDQPHLRGRQSSLAGRLGRERAERP